MYPSLWLPLLALGITTAIPVFNQSLDTQWSQWKTQHGRVYAQDEEGQRRAVWEKNMRLIDEHNEEYSQGKRSFSLAMNAFGDMASEEFGQMMNGFVYKEQRTGELFSEPLSLQVPSSLDWREKGYVTPVKDQRRCGSCWAFSATGALEGQMFRKTGRLISLSEQNLIDCSQPQGNGGCRGGLAYQAFRYVKENGGLDSEDSYPYEGRNLPCRYNPRNSVANVTGFVRIPAREEALMKAVATVGPIAVALDASHPSFQFYKEGIYYEPDCRRKHLNHALLVVGYGFEGSEMDNNTYWLVKNSWGQKWGMHGYFKLAKDRNNHCGIVTEASYPTV
ncbi:procathepsin L-like [Ochotona princeps]|uniref:procathepsin L-like n=1 Tax=Ochotona princeps TaxID=9978 RepID=UPI0027145B09|nr:procathepsin L-like [Ochotona princeps]